MRRLIYVHPVFKVHGVIFAVAGGKHIIVHARFIIRHHARGGIARHVAREYDFLAHVFEISDGRNGVFLFRRGILRLIQFVIFPVGIILAEGR